ncbi:potassium channel family protein [Motilibacter aurantiacus]|uniref:potassium channel family protein n=1 Tax=Motilibacter aurantiacus TaxID=2714955 RepID=UPI0038B2F74E
MFRRARELALRLVLKLANNGRVLFWALLLDYVACAAAYALLEDKGPISSLWWAIVTGFTVGYGDFYPETTAGRGIGAFLIVTTWFLSLLAGAFITARAVIDADEFSHEEQEEIKASLRRIEERLGTLPADT